MLIKKLTFSLATAALIVGCGTTANRTANDVVNEVDFAQFGLNASADIDSIAIAEVLEEVEAGQVSENDNIDENVKGKRFKVLAKYDVDEDGKLSEEEKSALKEARKAKRLEKFDIDEDGELSEEERMALKKAIKHKMQNKKLKRGKRGPKFDRSELSKEEICERIMVRANSVEQINEKLQRVVDRCSE